MDELRWQHVVEVLAVALLGVLAVCWAVGRESRVERYDHPLGDGYQFFEETDPWKRGAEVRLRPRPSEATGWQPAD